MSYDIRKELQTSIDVQEANIASARNRITDAQITIENAEANIVIYEDRIATYQHVLDVLNSDPTLDQPTDLPDQFRTDGIRHQPGPNA